MASRELRRAKARAGDTGAEVIEKKKQAHPLLYVLSVILLVVVVVTFVGSGIAGKLTGAGSVVFGSYDGRDITWYPGSYFEEQRSAIAQQYRDAESQGQDLELIQQTIWYQAYRQTAVHVATMLQAEKAGLHVSEDAVDGALLKNPRYMENGRFSEELYRRAQNHEREQVRRLAREQVMTDIYFRDMFTGLKPSTKEKEFVTAMARPERSFTFVSFPYADYPADEVRAYGAANSALFRKIKLSRILVKSGEREAKEIRRRISEKTSSFEELAKAHSKDGYAEKGGDMGWRYAYDLQADFENKDTAQELFSLRAGDVSEVMKGSFGWLLYRCDADPVEADLADTAVLEVVRTYLSTYEKGKIEDYFTGRGEQFARRAEAVGFAAAAREAGVAPIATDFLPVNLQNVFSFAPLRAVPEEATPPAAAYSEEFFQTGFALAKDKVSAPVVLDDQVLVLSVLAQRELPEATAGILGSWLEYTANQGMQADLQAQLMDPAKLKDRFMEAFGKLYERPTRG